MVFCWVDENVFEKEEKVRSGGRGYGEPEHQTWSTREKMSPKREKGTKNASRMKMFH